MTSENEGPTMREILETHNVDELERVLGEIIKSAGLARAIIASGAPDSWDKEALRRYAGTVVFHAEAIEPGIAKLIGPQKPN